MNRARKTFMDALAMLDQLQGIQDGRADEQRDGKARNVPPTRPSRRHSDESTPGNLPRDLEEALYRAPEPRRQRKVRDMSARKVYTLKTIRTAEMIQAIQSLTPAASSIVVHLAMHPRRSVNDIAAALDLKRKTVQNLLSVLATKKLITTDKA